MEWIILPRIGVGRPVMGRDNIVVLRIRRSTDLRSGFT